MQVGLRDMAQPNVMFEAEVKFRTSPVGLHFVQPNLRHPTNSPAHVDPIVENLRRQALDAPAAVVLAAIEEGIMQTMRAALPELDLVGHHAIATPEVR